MTDDDAVKVDAAFERDHATMGNVFRLGFRLSGKRVIEIDAARDNDIAARMAGRPTDMDQRAAAKATFDFADELYAMVFGAAHRAVFATAVTYKADHPTKTLRNQIIGLEAQIEDLQAELATVRTQRDELRRIFDQPPQVPLAGIDTTPRS